MIRQPIVLIMGHVDHGKSSLLERIKGISITSKEAGGITQTIKSYNVPIETICTCCGSLAENLKKVKIPGLLFLDSPGHFAFNNLRKRGGSLADIAILVIDINEGLQPQTKECLEILKETKTPFIVALNKVDIQQGWIVSKESLATTLNTLSPAAQQRIDKRLYEIVAQLFEYGFSADRYDRVSDFTQNVCLVPTSAKTGQGLGELLMLVAGLAQKYLEKNLNVKADGPGKATVLEVTNEKGMGRCLDIILYDGELKVGDQIVMGTLTEPVVTKVKALLEPEKNKLVNVKKVTAAYGVKLCALNIDHVIAGMPVLVANTNLAAAKKDVQAQVQETTFEIDEQGVVIKADNMGSLEALMTLLKEKKIQIKRASIGTITKKDIAEASSEINELYKIILGFNVECHEKETPITVITEPVIYALIDKYELWKEKAQERLQSKARKDLPTLCKIRLLPGYIFRKSGPAVMGVEVQEGTLDAGTDFYSKDTKEVVTAKSLQENAESISKAEKGKEIAVAFPGATVGKQLIEGDILYTNLTDSQFKRYKELKNYLKDSEVQLLKEIVHLRRETSPLWGI